MTIISCPFCSTQYDIDDSILKIRTQKLLCANCDSVFEVNESGTKKVTDKPEQKGFEETNKSEETIEQTPLDAEIVELNTQEENDDKDKNNQVELKIHAPIDDEKNIEQVITLDIKPGVLKTETSDATQTNTEALPQQQNDNNHISAEKNQKSDKPVTQMSDVFERIERNAHQIAEIENNYTSKKEMFFNAIGWTSKKNKTTYVIVFAILILLTINYYRFEITRKIPAMKNVFAMVGVNSVVEGEGLRFINIEKREFQEEFVNYMEIKGFIENTTDKAIKLPKIYASLLSDKAFNLYSQEQNPPVDFVDANDRTAFRIIIKKPSPLANYVYLTFVK